MNLLTYLFGFLLARLMDHCTYGQTILENKEKSQNMLIISGGGLLRPFAEGFPKVFK